MIYIKSGDAEIAYQVLGSGSPVVLLHPFPVHHEFGLPAAQVLTSRYQLILPDLRGCGRSTCGLPDGQYTPAAAAGDLAALLDALGTGPADVLGFSYGGLIAQRLALAAPRRIRRLVIASSSILPVPPGAFDGWPERTRRRAAAAAVWSDPAWSDPSRSGPELTRAAAVASAPADVWRPQARPGYLDRLAGVAELASSNRSTISARHGALKSSGMVQMYSDEDRTPGRSITWRPGTIRGLDA